MNEVARVRVGQIVRLARRAVDVDPLLTYTQIGVRSFGKGVFHYAPVTGSELGKLRYFEIHPRELIVSNIKGWEGAIAVTSEADAGCIASNRFLTYVPKNGKADVRYLSYFFLTETGLELIRRASPGSTDRNLTLGIDAFEALDIPLPAITEQRRIANYLSNVQAEVDHLITGPMQRRNELIAALAARNPLSLTSWLRARSETLSVLGEVATWGSGGTPSSKNGMFYEGDIPWAVIGDLNNGIVNETAGHLTEAGLQASSAKIVPRGAVLVAMYGSIGKLGISGVEMATNQAIAHAIPTRVSAEYLFWYLRAIQPQLFDKGQGGAQKNISQTILKKVPIPLVGREVEKQFVREASRMFSQLEALERHTSNATNISKSLVPAAINHVFANLV